MATPTLERVITDALAAAPWRRLYGIIDGARCPDLVSEAENDFGLRPRSLFLPELWAELREVSPYVVEIDPARGYLARWAARFGTSAGVLLISGADGMTVREHLRRTFVVTDETGQEFFFRYYDPRVLRPFLPTCSSAQMDEFFGPVDEFAVESDDATSLVRYGNAQGRLVETHARLKAAHDVQA